MTFRRVRVRTGKLSADGAAILFPTCSNNWHAGTERDSRGACDLFAVFCPPLGTTYLVSTDAVGTKAAIRRIRPARNNQNAGVRWAREYELGCPADAGRRAGARHGG